MLNNFIGGGQVFLHKIRMLRQVVGTTIMVSLLSGAILAWSFNSSSTHKVDGMEQQSIEDLRKLICKSDNEELKEYLKESDSAKHFSKDNIKIAASIMSVLMTGIKPLRFLSDKSESGSFSIQNYLQNVDAGSSSWLFLAAEPSTRELTIPLNASLAQNELVSYAAMRKSNLALDNDKIMPKTQESLEQDLDMDENGN